MRKLVILFLSLVLIVGSGVSAWSAPFNSILTSTTTSEILTLSCFRTPINGSSLFTYLLGNPAGNTGSIRGLTLEFPGVPVTDFVVSSTPTGWISGVVIPQSKVIWSWTNFADPTQQLDPGEVFQFGFTTALPRGPDGAVNASAQDGHGFSGNTCGPGGIIPEPMSMLLGAMGLCSILGFRKLKA